MKTDPVTVLWHALRTNEAVGGNFLKFKLTWVTDDAQHQWEGTNERTEELFELYRQHGLPTTIELVDTRKEIPETYRCRICGGLVKFDGTAPESPSANTTATSG